ncbi:MAG TPA: hypothetical protein VHS78_09380 [Candidatus Elarobacter sp.]|jgi:hypothetical protein|nr:hypothetical protein [Candidatus Elarobacter sp.]
MTDAEIAAAAIPVVHRGIISLPMDRHHAEMARNIINRYPPHLRALADQIGIRTVLIGPFQKYRDYSPLLRHLRVDRWPKPPLGVFVIAERTLYVSYPAPVVVAHEYAHAIDCALGGGAYFSVAHPGVRRALRRARKRKSFITRHAGSGVDEYFAEGMRAMIGVDDHHHPRPAVGRACLRRLDRDLFEILNAIFEP